MISDHFTKHKTSFTICGYHSLGYENQKADSQDFSSCCETAMSEHNLTTITGGLMGLALQQEHCP